jgi:hypothetical protein
VSKSTLDRNPFFGVANINQLKKTATAEFTALTFDTIFRVSKNKYNKE